jgi:branched-chain amino acid transport system permease protein
MMFKSSLALSMLSQMPAPGHHLPELQHPAGAGRHAVFGHAVYAGLGSFLAVHAMNLVAKGSFYIPLPLIPLVGGLSGLFFAVLFGYVTTKKAGTTFAMITLGVGELVFAMSLMFPEFFGGEGGITTNRAYGKPVFGISFGPQIQVYYLIASTALSAPRRCSPSRARRWAASSTPCATTPSAWSSSATTRSAVRYYAFIIAGFFAGIGGGLAAINSRSSPPKS